MFETIKLIFQNLKMDSERAGDSLKRNSPKFLKAMIWLCIIFMASFLVTIPLVIFGISYESKTMIVSAGVIRAVMMGLFLLVISPLGVTLEILKDGFGGSVKRYINFVTKSFLAELVFVALMAWIPLKNNPDLILLFIVLSAVVFFISSDWLKGRIIAFISVGLLGVTIFSFYAPYSMQVVGSKMKVADEKVGMPRRIDSEMTCQGIRSNEYKFFGDKGESLNYYSINPKTGEMEVFVLVSKNRTNPATGVLLEPLTLNLTFLLEEQLCRRDKVKEIKAQEKAVVESKAAQVSKAKSAISPAVQKPKSKNYQYAILSGNLAGSDGHAITEALASSDARIYNANGMKYEAARDLAKFLIVVDKADTNESKDSDLNYGETVIELKIVDAESGKVTRYINANSRQGAFDAPTARKFALSAAISSIKEKLKNAL